MGFWAPGLLSGCEPPRSLLCCEAPPFVCHLFTLLAQAIVVRTMRSRSTASWIGSGFFIPALRTLVTSERQWLRARRAITSSKAQRHSTYPIKRVQHSAPWCCMPSEKAAWAPFKCGFGFHWLCLNHNCISLWKQTWRCLKIDRKSYLKGNLHVKFCLCCINTFVLTISKELCKPWIWGLVQLHGV